MQTSLIKTLSRPNPSHDSKLEVDIYNDNLIYDIDRLKNIYSMSKQYTINDNKEFLRLTIINNENLKESYSKYQTKVNAYNREKRTYNIYHQLTYQAEILNTIISQQAKTNNEEYNSIIPLMQNWFDDIKKQINEITNEYKKIEQNYQKFNIDNLNIDDYIIEILEEEDNHDEVKNKNDYETETLKELGDYIYRSITIILTYRSYCWNIGKDTTDIIESFNINHALLKLNYVSTRINRIDDSKKLTLLTTNNDLKPIKKLNLLDRFELANKILNIDKSISTLNIQVREKQELLALILDCDIDSAKSLMNGNYNAKPNNLEEIYSKLKI